MEKKHKCKLIKLSSSVEGIKTELSRNVKRKRSRRFRRPESSWFGDQEHFHEMKGIKNENESSTQVSSISDASPEEAVAYCLMMLSRDKWIDDEKEKEESEKELVSDSESDSDSESVTEVKRLPARNCYTCQTCNRIFRSYQALGGHIASHKKTKHNPHHQMRNVSVESKLHECHVCYKVFASGQALGGHKRSHVSAKAVVKRSTNPIDLNLPAPNDDNDDDYC